MAAHRVEKVCEREYVSTTNSPCFLQGDVLQGAGLLAIFSVAWLVRSVLEPRLVGRSLGLDPLISLMAFYVGFKVWGILGMILAPMAAALIKSFIDNSQIIHKETS